MVKKVISPRTYSKEIMNYCIFLDLMLLQKIDISNYDKSIFIEEARHGMLILKNNQRKKYIKKGLKKERLIGA